MKCLVPIKRVIDPYVNIRVKPDNTGVVSDNVKMAINPFDEIAIEESVKLKEQSIVTEIIIVSIGSNVVQESLRQGLARGGDKAILINTQEELEPLIIAKTLQKVATDNAVDFIIMGKQAIDDDNNQTGQMLAALMQCAQATFISRLDVNKDAKTATAIREVDGGLETITVNLPAVFTTDLRLNEPRYISLPNVMKAKSKPLDIIDFTTLGITNKKTVEVLKVEAPKSRTAGIKLTSAAELVEKLKNEKLL